MFNIRIFLPRTSEYDEVVENLKNLSKSQKGKAEWDNSGKGNAYGNLTCTFEHIDNAGAFMVELLLQGYNIDARFARHFL